MFARCSSKCRPGCQTISRVTSNSLCKWPEVRSRFSALETTPQFLKSLSMTHFLPSIISPAEPSSYLAIPKLIHCYYISPVSKAMPPEDASTTASQFAQHRWKGSRGRQRFLPSEKVKEPVCPLAASAEDHSDTFSIYFHPAFPEEEIQVTYK